MVSKVSWVPFLALMGALPLDLAGCSETQAAQESAVAALGTVVPDFTLRDLEGRVHTLSQYRGKTVVLEWFNPGCPFVKDTHEPGGSMSGLASGEMDKGVVWLAINSGAPGRDGSVLENNRVAAGSWGLQHPILLDAQGTVGHLYGAATTPSAYIIDPNGILVYRGAVDNRPLGLGTGNRVNYIVRALDDLRAGRAVQTPDTRPYGCGVKYGS